MLGGMWSSPPFPMAQGCVAADPSDLAALSSQATMPAIKNIWRPVKGPDSASAEGAVEGNLHIFCIG